MTGGGTKPGGRRAGCAVLVAAALVAVVPSATASVQLGSVARGDLGVTCDGAPADLFATGAAPRVGAARPIDYTVSGAGTITSWESYAGGAGGRIAFKVFRPGGGLYTVAAAEPPRDLVPLALNGFLTSIPVQPGDVIGFNDNGVPSGCVMAGPTPLTLLERVGNLGAGQAGAFASLGPGSIPNLRAYMTPSNEFTVDLERKGRKGAVTMRLALPGPGELKLKSGRLKAPREITVAVAGEVERVLRPKAKTRRQLRRRSRVNAKLKVTYQPTGGAPSERQEKLRLRRR